MKKIAVALFLFLAFGDFVNAQNKDCFTLNFFGHQYRFDSIQMYSDGMGIATTVDVFPWKTCFEYSFYGKEHFERRDYNPEDPNNPGLLFTSDDDTISNLYHYYSVVDSLNFTQLKKDSIFKITIGKKSYPVCEYHIVGDSMSARIGNVFMMNETDKKIYYGYEDFLITRCCYNSLKESNCHKIIVTDIYYYDWDQKKKIKLDVSILIKK